MAEIVIYTAKDGHIELDVNFTDKTVWLTINQMVQLFGRDKSVISRHLNKSEKQLLQNLQQFKKKAIEILSGKLNITI